MSILKKKHKNSFRSQTGNYEDLNTFKFELWKYFLVLLY